MNLMQAINLNPVTAIRSELSAATRLMKAQYTRTKNALEQKGVESYLIDTMTNRIENDPVFRKRESELTMNELKHQYAEYRSYSGHKVFDPVTEKFLGWGKNETATAKGAIKYLETVGTKVLGIDAYSDMSIEERSSLWNAIDDIRNAEPAYFRRGSGVYGSDENIKKVTQWVQQGYSRSEIIEMLKGHVTKAKEAEEAERATRIAQSPFDLVNRKYF